MFDVVVAAVLLVMTAPVMAVVALVVLAHLGKPVLFRDPRVGLDGAEFDLLKFRTMRELRDDRGELLSDAERLTGIGRFLRRWSLDELPELVNVLRGEMSLVGPRPLPARYLPRFTAAQMTRHELLPGITGWAQVNGRNMVSWSERFELDMWYREHQSFMLDLRILGMTVGQVVRSEGISADGHPTMPEFTGEAE